MTEIFQYKTIFKEAIIKLILKIQTDEFNIPITEEAQPDLKSIESFYQKDGGNFWVAVDKNEVVGTIALKNIDNNNAALRKMFVKSEFRGKEKGISSKLLSELLNWAKAKQFKKIFLGTTPQFLAAHRFYEKNGFSKISKEELPVDFPVMEVDKIFYCYNLEYPSLVSLK